MNYKPYPQNPKYLIGDDGSVLGINGKQMSLSQWKNGYNKVKIYTNGVAKTCAVHRLVAETFFPEFKESCVVDHINGIKTDNRIENLRVTTSIANINYKFENFEVIGKEIRRLIQKYGYDGLNKILEGIE
jgi:hypothetical protein